MAPPPTMARKPVLGPRTSKILFVKNLPYKSTGDDLYNIFSKYGFVRQIRMGNEKNTKGTSFVVYEEIAHAKKAVDALSGFNVEGRYLVVSFFHPTKKKAEAGGGGDVEKQKLEVEELRAQYRLVQEGKQQ